MCPHTSDSNFFLWRKSSKIFLIQISLSVNREFIQFILNSDAHILSVLPSPKLSPALSLTDTNTLTLTNMCKHSHTHTFYAMHTLKFSQSHISSFNTNSHCSLSFCELFLLFECSYMLLIASNLLLGLSLHKQATKHFLTPCILKYFTYIFQMHCKYTNPNSITISRKHIHFTTDLRIISAFNFSMTAYWIDLPCLTVSLLAAKSISKTCFVILYFLQQW